MSTFSSPSTNKSRSPIGATGPKPAGTALVVGGTRILAPAVARLEALGWHVDVVTRNPDWRLAADRQVTPVVTDATDLPRWGAALETHGPPAGWDLALAYMPFAPPEAWRMLARRVTGRLVAILTSTVADPARSGLPLPPLRGPSSVVAVVLGWQMMADGPAWHGSKEISAAAVRAALADPAHERGMPRGLWPEAADLSSSVLLGRVRPWPQRPAG